MNAPDEDIVVMKIPAIILAAGEGRRMGRAKQTLPFGGATMLEAVVRTLQASAVDRVAVVLGYRWQEVSAVLAGGDVETVVNPHPERGMLSSVQCGLARVAEDADAFLIALADQPHLQVRTVHALIAAAEKTGKGIVLPTFDGKRGHPVLFRTRYRAEILALPLSVGLNQIAKTHPDDVEEVALETPTVLQDIDTPEDYLRALEEP